MSRIMTSTGSAVDAVRYVAASMQEIEQVTTAIASTVEEQGAATEISRNASMAAQGTKTLARNLDRQRRDRRDHALGRRGARGLAVAFDRSRPPDPGSAWLLPRAA
jgi:hypothetical protein